MYVNYFGLKGKPFGLYPDPRFFFSSAVHKQALSALAYGLGQRQGFVVVTGDSGTGKSTLMSALLHMFASTNVISAKILNTQLECEEMLRYVAAELDLTFEGQDKISLLKSIESYIEECSHFKRRIVVIIDEAQNLSEPAIEELRMLMNLVGNKESILQFVLFGQSTLSEKLHTQSFEPIRQRIVSSYQLHNFNKDETMAYVAHRLRTVGWVGQPEFSPTALSTIHEYSDGIPGKINMLCEKVLQAAGIQQLDEITKTTVTAAIDEINQNFEDGDFSHSIVEGVIDALVEERDSQLAEVEQNKAAMKVANDAKIVEERQLKLRQMKEQRAKAQALKQARIIDLDELSNVENQGQPSAENQAQQTRPLSSDQARHDQNFSKNEKNISQSKSSLDSEVKQWLQKKKLKSDINKKGRPQEEEELHL